MMRTIFTVLILASSLLWQDISGNVYWEEVPASVRSVVINNPEVSQKARLLTTAKDLSGAEIDDSLLSELINCSDDMNINALRFYLLNKAALCADGDLAEIMGKYLIAYTFDHPENVLCYLYNDHHLTEVYEIFIGYEIAFSQDLLSDCSVSYHSFYQKLNESKYPDYLVSFKNTFLETIDRKIECYREGQ